MSQKTHKDTIETALKKLAEVKRLKRKDYKRLNVESSKAKEFLNSYKLPNETKITEILHTGSYKFLTGVKYENNEFDIDHLVILESDKIGTKDADVAKGVKSKIIEQLRESYKNEQGKEIVYDKKPVINVTYKASNNDDMFHLDFALMFKIDEKLYHLNRKNNGDKYELVESEIVKMTDDYSDIYGDNTTFILRNASVLLKWWNSNIFKNDNKNAKIPSIAFTSLVCKTNEEDLLPVITEVLSKITESFKGSNFTLETSYEPITEIFSKQNPQEAKLTKKKLDNLLENISKAINTDSAKEAIDILKPFFKGLEYPRDEGEEDEQEPGRAG